MSREEDLGSSAVSLTQSISPHSVCAARFWLDHLMLSMPLLSIENLQAADGWQLWPIGTGGSRGSYSDFSEGVFLGLGSPIVLGVPLGCRALWAPVLLGGVLWGLAGAEGSHGSCLFWGGLLDLGGCGEGVPLGLGILGVPLAWRDFGGVEGVKRPPGSSISAGSVGYPPKPFLLGSVLQPQSHGILRVGRDLSRPSGPAPCSAQGHHSSIRVPRA